MTHSADLEVEAELSDNHGGRTQTPTGPEDLYNFVCPLMGIYDATLSARDIRGMNEALPNSANVSTLVRHGGVSRAVTVCKTVALCSLATGESHLDGYAG